MIRFVHKGLTIDCISIGGVETCYILPHYNIAFDAGRCPEQLIDIDNLFVTHGHLDHASGIPYYLGQRSLKRATTANIYLPEKLKDPLEKIISIWHEVEDYKFDINLIPLKIGEQVKIRKNHHVEALKTFHRIPCLGYVLLQEVTKLKEEYLHLPGPQIKKLKNQKEEIFEHKTIPLFAFSGDSTIEFVLENEYAMNAKVLFMECTYIDEKRPVAKARQWGHTHLDEIFAHAEKFKNEKVVLVHLSKRYSPRYTEKIIRERAPEALKDKLVVLHQYKQEIQENHLLTNQKKKL